MLVIQLCLTLCNLTDRACWSSLAAEISNLETKHHIHRVGELRVIMPVGPEELTLQSLSPEQRSYRVFCTDRQARLSRFACFQGLGQLQRAGQG